MCWNITRVKSVVTVQSAFRAKYAKDRPTDKNIRAWYKQFIETGCLCKQKSSGLGFKLSLCSNCNLLTFG